MAAAKVALEEAEAKHAEVQGTLSNNLLKRKAELEGQLVSLSANESRCRKLGICAWPLIDRVEPYENCCKA